MVETLVDQDKYRRIESISPNQGFLSSYQNFLKPQKNIEPPDTDTRGLASYVCVEEEKNILCKREVYTEGKAGNLVRKTPQNCKINASDIS